MLLPGGSIFSHPPATLLLSLSFGALAGVCFCSAFHALMHITRPPQKHIFPGWAAPLCAIFLVFIPYLESRALYANHRIKLRHSLTSIQPCCEFLSPLWLAREHACVCVPARCATRTRGRPTINFKKSHTRCDCVQFFNSRKLHAITIFKLFQEAKSCCWRWQVNWFVSRSLDPFMRKYENSKLALHWIVKEFMKTDSRAV